MLLNVITGNCLAFKKSGLRRCSSRFWLFVSMLAGLIESSNADFSGLAESIVNWPPNSSNRPWIQDRPRWEILKLTPAWAPSTANSSARTRGDVGLPNARGRGLTPAAHDQSSASALTFSFFFLFFGLTSSSSAASRRFFATM